MMQRKITLFFVALFLIFSIAPLAAQNAAPPSTSALSTFASNFAQKLSLLAADTNVTFEQVKPFFAVFFEQYRQKVQLQRRSKPETRYLFVVTTDGLRWQEVFGGADSSLLYNPDYTPDPEGLAVQFQAETPEARRARLMPFLWSVVQQNGQIYGNRRCGNFVNVANNKWFSYPGYNELFTGNPDDSRIIANIKLSNPNTNVLEFLHQKRGFRNKVAAFSTWDVFPYILNEKRAGFTVSSGSENKTERPGDSIPDAATWAAARKYARQRHPKVLFVGLDDTDHFAHDGRYDKYLQAAHRVDTWLSELWNFIQSDRKYRNRTTLIITTDHGRGDKLKKEWREHNARVEGSDEIWFAVIGPDTPPLGEVRAPMQLWQKQLAQTMAGLLGHTFQCEHPVAPRIESVFRSHTDHILPAATLGAGAVVR